MSDQTPQPSKPATQSPIVPVAPKTPAPAIPAAPKPKPLRQTPTVKPGPGLPVKPPTKDNSQHFTLRKVKGTLATVGQVVQASDMPAPAKAFLAAQLAAVKGQAVTLDAHVFQSDTRFTVHVHIEVMF